MYSFIFIALILYQWKGIFSVLTKTSSVHVYNDINIYLDKIQIYWVDMFLHSSDKQSSL